MSAATLRGLWLQARAALAGLPPEEAKRDARLLIQAALRLTPTQFVTGQGEALEVPKGAVDHLEWMLARRAARWPVTRILGEASFWGRRFEVTADTLAPRADSERLIVEALSRTFDRVLDLGTGTGCLAITLLLERPDATAVATDCSAAALAVAARNTARHGVTDRLRLIESDWDAEVEGTFDLVLSNPPYIAEADWADLSEEVRGSEPKLALSPGATGLEAYEVLAPRALGRLTPGGWALFEIGFDQGQAVMALLRAAGYQNVALHQDLSGKDRVVAGQAAPLRL